MTIAVRRVSPGEEGLASYVAATFKHGELTAERAIGFLANRDNYLVVADIEGEVAGFVLAYRLERLDRPAAQLFVYEIDVRPAHQRRGVGRALMSWIQQRVRDEGMMEAFVFTDRHNAAATGLYLSTGAHIENDAGCVCVYPGAREHAGA